jgi:hypothetical protein
MNRPIRTNAEIAYENTIRPMLKTLQNPQSVCFLGRDWRVTGEDVTQMGGEPAHINAKGVLVWYFTFSDREGEPSYEFASIQSFSHGIFNSARWVPGVNITAGRFRETAARLGANFYRKERYGESWIYAVLPKIITLLSYAEGDDEFPASLDIKYGKNATRYLPFETLAVLHGLIGGEFRSDKVEKGGNSP